LTPDRRIVISVARARWPGPGQEPSPIHESRRFGRQEAIIMSSDTKTGHAHDQASHAHDHGHVHGPGCNHDHDHHHAPMAPSVRGHRKVGRNDPCPCGSGKKYKKCCLNAA
jgi:preprotein translocase subunit SecA